MYYLYHTRKTGGRSIIHSFMQLVTSKPERFYERLARQPGHRLEKSGKAYVGWEPETIKRGQFFFGFSHTPKHALSLPPETFTIVCFRDPLARLMSYFNYLQDIKRAVAADPNHVHANMPDLAWADGDPITFLTKVPQKHLLAQLFMFSKVFDINAAITSISTCSFALTTEKIEAGLKGLSEKIKQPLLPVHFGASKTRYKFPQHFLKIARQALTPEFQLIDRLRKQEIIK